MYGRQWQFAQVLQRLLVGDADGAQAVLVGFQYANAHRVGPLSSPVGIDNNLGTHAQATTRPTQRLPDARLQPPHQQDLDVRSGSGFRAMQSGRDNTAAVEHHQVAGAEIVGEVAESPVLDVVSGAPAM